MNPRIYTHDIAHMETLYVPVGTTVLSIFQGPSNSAQDWPGARVLLLKPQQDAIKFTKMRFFILSDGEELPNDMVFAGTVVNANPRYTAHYGYKLIND